LTPLNIGGSAHQFTVLLAVDLVEDFIREHKEAQLVYSFPERGRTGRPFIVVDSAEQILLWNIPGAIPPRLQRIAEAAVSELLAVVPGLLEAPEQVGGVANPVASKYPTGAAEFAPGVQTTHRTASALITLWCQQTY
jgi:hypothetical protein